MKNKKNNQKGAALIEVMLAAVVLAVGSIAYLNLQRTGLQSSFNDYARTQSTSISRSFIDSLRSNIHFISLAAGAKNSVVIGQLAAVNPPQSDASCTVPEPGLPCATATLAYHQYQANQQMLSGFRAGQSLLCYTESPDRIGYMRVSMIWADNSNAENAVLTAALCPNDFEDSIDDDFINNSVTIYAQL